MIDRLKNLRSHLVDVLSEAIDKLTFDPPRTRRAPLPRSEQEKLREQHEEVMQLAKEVEEQAKEGQDLLDQVDLPLHHSSEDDDSE